MIAMTEAMEILDKVHSFYNDAWSNLLWVVGCIGGVVVLLVTVVVPYWLERSRRMTFEKSSEDILAELKRVRERTEAEMARLSVEFAKRMEEAVGSWRTEFEAGKAEIEVKIVQAEAKACAWSQYSNAARLFGESKAVEGAAEAATAAWMAKIGNSRQIAVMTLSLLAGHWRGNPGDYASEKAYFIAKHVLNSVEKVLTWLEAGEENKVTEKALVDGREILAGIKAVMDEKRKAGFEAGLKSPAEPGEKGPKDDESDENGK